MTSPSTKARKRSRAPRAKSTSNRTVLERELARLAKNLREYQAAVASDFEGVTRRLDALVLPDAAEVRTLRELLAASLERESKLSARVAELEARSQGSFVPQADVFKAWGGGSAGSLADSPEFKAESAARAQEGQCVRTLVERGLDRATDQNLAAEPAPSPRSLDDAAELRGRELAEALWGRFDAAHAARATKVTIDSIASASNYPGEALRILIAEELGHPIGFPIVDEVLRYSPVTRAAVIRWNELVRAGDA